MRGAIALAAAGALSAALAGALWAQTTDHSGHTMTGEETPATIAYMEINARMHADMDIAFTGDPDVDFVKGMIVHHRGAVEMARVVLEHGDDPDVRKLAEDVIAAQEAEMAWMEEWLARNGG